MASKFAGKKCPMCSFEAATVRIILSHLRIVHSNDSRFNVTCGVDGCSRTFRTFSAFYSHIYRQHKNSGIILRDRIQKNPCNTEPFEAVLLCNADPPMESFGLDDPHGRCNLNFFTLQYHEFCL